MSSKENILETPESKWRTRLGTVRDFLQKRRILVFLLVLFIVLDFALIIGLIVAATKPSDGHQKTSAEDVCLTEGCVSAAYRVRNAMDPSFSPCDDFHQFACGSWLKQNVIPEDKSKYGIFYQIDDEVLVKLKYLLEVENKPDEPEVMHKARDFFKACVNEERIEQLGLDFIHDYMEKLGGWPIMGNHRGGKWNSKTYNLEDLMILVRNDTNYLPFVDIWVSQDDKNPSKYIVTIDQTSLGMPSRDYFLKARNDSTLLAYQKMIKDLAVAFGADPDTAEQDVKDFVDFEIELANITMRREDRRDPEKLYNKMALRDLAKYFTGLDWMKLAKGTFNHIGMDIDENEPVNVMAPPYFEKLMGVINKYPSRVVANYLVADRIIGKEFMLPANFYDIKLQYTKVLTGKATRSPRWEDCGSFAVGGMKEVVGRLFIEEHFRKEAKDDVNQMVENLRATFKEMLAEADWMEDATKTFAKDKVDYIEPRIGYPDYLYNVTRLTEKYKWVKVDREDPLASYMSFVKAAVQRNLRLLRKDYDKSVWSASATTVNAYYQMTTNQITFPAAVLQPPFYSKDQPAYLNYGGIGFLIGHEITHGFDDEGRQYDKDGSLKSWWSETDAKKFKDRAQCMIDQYDKYLVPGTGNMTINGIITQGENIADNGGLEESFRAYRKFVATNGKEEAKLPGLEYTSNQLYFISAAQVWCGKSRDKEKIRRIRSGPYSLERFRIIGPMQNNKDFAEAFHCPVGSKMNPREKCTVW